MRQQAENVESSAVSQSSILKKPCETQEELQALEDVLQDEANRNQMMIIMRGLGGSQAQSLISRILQALVLGI